MIDSKLQGDWFEGASFFSWCISERTDSPFTGCNTHLSFPDNTVISFSSVVNDESEEWASTATVTGITGPKSLQKPLNLAIETTEVEYEQFDDAKVLVYALEFTYVNGKGWNPFYEYDLTNDFHN